MSATVFERDDELFLSRLSGGLSLFEGARCAPSRTLQDVFAATVSAFPGRVALDDGLSVLTYLELDAAARQLAARLSAAGIGRGDRVGVRVADGTAELYLAVLGVLLSGAAYVPVDVADPEARAREIWREAGVAAVVGGALEITLLRPGRGATGSAQPGDDCWVIFTSGSTGAPKGVAVTHRSAGAFVDAEATLWQVRAEDRVLAALSVGFDASCEEMWLAWRHGAALVPAPRRLVKAGCELGPWLAARAVTVISTVPTLAAMWDEHDLELVRLLILGGEACPDHLATLVTANREVWNTYGPTEATVVSTAARIVPGEPVTIGLPLPGWSAAVVDSDGELLAFGKPGELIIGGVGLARYLDAELDGRRFAPVPALGWSRAYRTGDVVRATPSGLEYVGRRDDQVKIGGRRIELGEIEARLSAVSGVRQGAAVVRRTVAGDRVLVAYFVGNATVADVRDELTSQLPSGCVPLVVPLVTFPLKQAGKVDRAALPWPPPDHGASSHDTAPDGFTSTERLLAEVWHRHLGVRPRSRDDDFFQLGGASLAAARVASDLRNHFPAFAVAEIYRHRSLGDLAARLEELEGPVVGAETAHLHARGNDLLQLAGVVALLVANAPAWLITVLVINDLTGAAALPRVPWPWLLASWLVFMSAPGRVVVVAAARRALLAGLQPGVYPRRSSPAIRVWFVARLAEQFRVAQYGGTPFAATVARLTGTAVGEGTSLGTIPAPGGVVTIGSGATLESDADVRGWYVEGPDLVIGPVAVGAGARVGSRAVLMPGASLGERAEVEPCSVVSGHVPAGERWAGVPARPVGRAGAGWPDGHPPAPPRSWRWAYAATLTVAGFLPLLALVPGILILDLLGGHGFGLADGSPSPLVEAPLVAVLFVPTYAVVTALIARAVGRLVRPGWHSGGKVAWAAWTYEQILERSRSVLFPLYSTIYTRGWMRLLGLRIGRRTELSTAMGLGPLVNLGTTAFVADDVVFNTGRSRDGWLHFEPISVDDGAFIGNGALLSGGTSLGTGSLVGVQTIPPRSCPAGTSWFGVPALEFPRAASQADPNRTVEPPARLVAARAAMDAIRILLPTTASIALGLGVLESLDAIAGHLGIAWTVALVVPVMLAAGVVAVLFTMLVKWGLIGRYRPGDHPLWSFFVWRDEIVNSCQEMLAGEWLLALGLGTRIMSWYLRLMGTKVGADVWCDTLTITEFEMVSIGDGVAINRSSCIETHLFHDRVMRIGPIRLGAGASIGPSTAVLPDSIIGERCSVGARSVVLRGEELPPNTRWHGAPVVAR